MTAPNVAHLHPPPDPTEAASGALAECVETYRRWLHLPDPGALYVALGAVAANLAPGDPLWLLLVGPPSAGKTETIGPLASLDYVHPAATLTEASLLSGTPKKERSDGSKGGLLREIGDFGIILCKDFTSVLAQNKDTRAAVLAALREIFDGAWTRHVGTDGGRTLAWSGKVGLVAGCTPAIDMHHAVVGAMGERMVTYRLPVADAEAVAADALGHIGQESAMRAELAKAVAGVLDHVGDGSLAELDPAERARLVNLAQFAVKCRTSVERDSYSRDVLMLPEAEGPARLVGTLRRLLGGLDTIGSPRGDTWRILAKVAMDCMPAARATVLGYLHGLDAATGTSAVAADTQLPTQTARRQLEDLALLGLVDRSKASTQDNAPDRWALTGWGRDHWPDPSVPESRDAA